MKNKTEIIESCFQKFKESTEGKLMHACNKNDDKIIYNMFKKLLLPYIEFTLQEKNKQIEEAIDELETFFIADWDAGDWHKRFPRFFHIHFDIMRNKIGLKPQHHPKFIKKLIEESKKLKEE